MKLYLPETETLYNEGMSKKLVLYVLANQK